MSSNLNLIPGSGKDFRSKEYWDKFFKIRGNKAFEWYGEYENLCDVLHKYVKLSDNTLMIGCGNSKLSENMYDVGIKNIINIDISNIVIQQMSTKNKHRKDMQFLKMDMLQMEFEDAKFDAVIDKGTLDAIMSDSSEKVDQDTEKMFSEIDRVLKVGGRYLCISLAQDHILDKLLNSFKEKGWIIRIHRLNEQDLEFHLPVFVFVFTKMKINLKSSNPIIELKLDLNVDKFTRTSSVDETKLKIKEYQNYGLTKFYITNKNIEAQDDVFVYLYDAVNQQYPRYTIYIIDSPSSVNKNKMNGIFAVFVVPIGKEIEWLFGTKLGREELTSQAKYNRLAVVHLNRAHTYESLDAIIAELSPKVMELAPKGIPASYKIPLLSMGPEVDVRDLKFKGISEISGEFFVEDVTPSESGNPTRRLLFQGIVPLIQTEVILKPESSKNKKKKSDKPLYKPDYSSFLEDYFSIILSQLCALKHDSEKNLNILIVGLGGGVLAMYCKTWLKNCVIDAVEIDPKVADVAKTWFGLNEDDRTHIYIDDGLKFIDQSSKQDMIIKGKKWDIVIIDINCTDPESELWGPTYDFVEPEFLKTCKSILNDPNGLLVINLICLSESLKKTIYSRLHSLWSNIYSNKLTKNRNEILFCTNQSKDLLFRKNAFNEKEKSVKNDDNNNNAGSVQNGNALNLFEEISSTLKEIKL